MINKKHVLPVARQAKLLDMSRSSIYYRPQPASESDLRLMRRIDELHLEHPFAGARMLRDMLRLDGIGVGSKRVGTLMKALSIEVLYRKANTSRHNQAHRSYPYRLCGLTIDHPNRVWTMDTTYIPIQRGFVYPCAEALEEAIAKYGAPEIMSADQGSQFTSSAFIGALEQNGIQLSMDGKGCWRGNVFVERRWKSENYEEVDLHGYETVSIAQQALTHSFDFYNRRRSHSTLDGNTSDTAYFSLSKPPLAAAA